MVAHGQSAQPRRCIKLSLALAEAATDSFDVCGWQEQTSFVDKKNGARAGC